MHNHGVDEELDVVVVGAGFAGLYMLHKMREIGVSARAFEAGSGVGGTWYWNRYPGARCDVESIDYTYSFSEELQREWRWSERYPAQPEILRYLNFVADKFDLRRDIQFETRVESAIFDDETNRWVVTTDQGDVVRAQFCVMATGCLSTPKRPGLDGAEIFQGPTYHTGQWPHEGVDFTGMRVGIIGTGSSAIQSIPQIAKQASQLTVFQRTPNFSIPAHNGPIDHEREQWSDTHFAEFRELARQSGFGSSNILNPQLLFDATPEERAAEFERRWQIGGVAFLGSFIDLLFNEQANEIAAEFVAREDPRDRARPRGRGVAHADRPPVRLEAPLRRHRLLRDLQPAERHARRPEDDPDRRVHARRHPHNRRRPRARRDRLRHGLRCDDRRLAQHRHPGQRRRLATRPVGRRTAHLPRADGRWLPEPLHHHRAGQPVGAEQHGHLDRAARGLARGVLHAPARERRRSHRTDRGVRGAVGTARHRDRATSRSSPANSWYVGANIPGKPRVFMPYVGGVAVYRQRCDEVVANGYQGFELTKSQAAAVSP